MNPSSHPRLVGDVGGTNARFAWVDAPGRAPSDVGVYRCADFATLQDALARYLADHGKPVPPSCAIGIANPVTGDEIRMTNHVWSFSIEAVRRHFGFGRLVVLNDFTALALSLPALRPDDLVQVGGGAAVAGASMALIGPGTGLGVSGLVAAMNGQGLVPVNGEGGHVTLPAGDAFETALVDLLHRRFGHASAERALSGPGLVNLYEAICAVEGRRAEELSAADVTTRDDPACRFSTLVDITAIDHPERAQRFDVVYHFLSMYRNHRIRVKVKVAEDEMVPSLVDLHPSANWFEREVFDMFGILFSGHPDLRRLLTDYGFRGYPLRKDFPTTGYTEVRYDEALKRVVYEPVKLVQEYRQFDFMSPWEGAEYILPGDQKGAK